MATPSRKLPYEQGLQECKLTTLKEGQKRGDLLETHKIMHDLERIPEDTFFARTDTPRRGLFKERSRREARRNFFSQRVVISWNPLPEKVVREGEARTVTYSEPVNFIGGGHAFLG